MTTEIIYEFLKNYQALDENFYVVFFADVLMYFDINISYFGGKTIITWNSRSLKMKESCPGS